MSESKHGYDVLVVGGGPTGMMLAGELRLAQVEVAILERRETCHLVGSRAGGFHSRTIELLDQRGIADRFLVEGQLAQVITFGSTVLDMGDLPTRHPYSLALWQNHIERILDGWVTELGVPVHRGVQVSDVTKDEDGVEITIASGGSMRARYLVGADGGRSRVRTATGIDFPGWEATRTSLIAEVEVTDPTPAGIRRDAVGVHGLHVMENGHTVRVVTTEQELGPATEPTLQDLSRTLQQVYGTDFGVHSPTWISRFSDATRQAESYRRGRVLLAGDAAHIHSPAGGQGIGLGLQDAVNLGWKLAQVVHGHSPTALLDTYHAERHAAGARALRYTMAQTLLQRSDGRTEALHDTIAELLAVDGARHVIAGLVSGLDVAYDLGEGHPLLGRRMPDLDLVTSAGPRRFFDLMHTARPVLVNLTGIRPADVSGWSERVTMVDASYEGSWALPVVGQVPTPYAVLVRPDGHVAWVGTRPASDQAGATDAHGGREPTFAGLRQALTTWFGRSLGHAAD